MAYQDDNCPGTLYPLMDCFAILSREIAKMYSNLPYSLPELVAEGILACFDKIDRYDRKRHASAFSFFTHIIKNAILQHHRNDRRLSKNLGKLIAKLEDQTLDLSRIAPFLKITP